MNLFLLVDQFQSWNILTIYRDSKDLVREEFGDFHDNLDAAPKILLPLGLVLGGRVIIWVRWLNHLNAESPKSLNNPILNNQLPNHPLLNHPLPNNPLLTDTPNHPFSNHPIPNHPFTYRHTKSPTFESLLYLQTCQITSLAIFLCQIAAAIAGADAPFLSTSSVSR